MSDMNSPLNTQQSTQILLTVWMIQLQGK